MRFLVPINHISHYGPIVVDADAATVTFDCAAADKHSLTLGGNRALALANIQPGQVVTVELVQPATGGPFTVTSWPTTRWHGGSAPTLSTAPGKVDLVTFYGRNDGSILGALSITETAPAGSTGTGTVTSVGLTVPGVLFQTPVAGSPVTGAGTLALALNTQAANTVLAGPATGAAAAPTMRALVGADLPSFGASGATHAVGAVPDPGATAGTTRFLREDATWAAPPAGGGTGTVTSVGLALPAIFTVTGSPVTGAGTLTGALATQAANLVWAGPTTGAAVAPTFRALVAADVPALDAAKITTGTLALARGGTGAADAATARTNLGLGTAATSAATAFASAITLNTGGLLHATPVTFTNSGGTFTGTQTLNTQVANTVLAGPTTGAAATPTMRALVPADIPALPESAITNLTTDLAAKATDTAVLHLAGAETVTGAKIFADRQRIDAHTAIWRPLPAPVTGTITIDWSVGDRWYGTLPNDVTTLVYAGVPAPGQSQVLLLRLTQPASGAAATVNWPLNTRHVGGVVVALSPANNAVDYVSVSLDPGGTLFETFLMGANLS